MMTDGIENVVPKVCIECGYLNARCVGWFYRDADVEKAVFSILQGREYSLKRVNVYECPFCGKKFQRKGSDESP